MQNSLVNIFQNEFVFCNLSHATMFAIIFITDLHDCPGQFWTPSFCLLRVLKRGQEGHRKTIPFKFFMITPDMKFLSSFGCKVHFRLLSKKVFSPTWVREVFCHSIWREDVIIITISQHWRFSCIGVLYSCLFLSNLRGKY